MTHNWWSIDKASFGLLGLSNALLLLVVAAIATLPSGTIAGLPVKYMLLLVVLAYFVFSGKRYAPDFLAHVGLVASFLLIYALYGYVEFAGYAVSELVLALGAILLGLLISHIMMKRRLGMHGILKIYFLSVLLLAGLKASILVAFLLSPGYEAFQVGFASAYQQLTGASFLTMPLPHGLIRIYMQNDLIAALFPLAVAMVKQPREVSHWDRAAVMLCMFIVLLGFSRYNMACYGLSLLIFLWHDKRGLFFKLILASGLLVLIAISFNNILEFIEIRFFSQQNEASDEIRIEQAGALLSLFWESPIVGHGLGAYTDDMIRSVVAPFSYEQQVLSLLPKFGALGFSVVLGYLGYLWLKMIKRRQFYAVSYFSLFVASSIFNPYLFSSNMVLVYALIFYVYFYGVYPKRNAKYG